MPSPGDWLVDTGNRISFWLRGALPWSLPAWSRKAGSWQRVQAPLSPPALARATELRGRFDLAAWPQWLSALEAQENLALLDLLQGILPAALLAGRGLDVGSKNGATLPALVAASPRPWDLIEIDAHRRYATLSTRRAHGEAMARHFPQSRYICGSVTSLVGPYAVITWILPFVHEGPLRAWGLPRKFFAPTQLLAHVCGLLAPGGTLIVVNQGEGERDTQRTLFSKLGLKPDPLGLLVTPLSPFRKPRYGFRWQRPRLGTPGPLPPG